MHSLHFCLQRPRLSTIPSLLPHSLRRFYRLLAAQLTTRARCRYSARVLVMPHPHWFWRRLAAQSHSSVAHCTLPRSWHSIWLPLTLPLPPNRCCCCLSPLCTACRHRPERHVCLRGARHIEKPPLLGLQTGSLGCLNSTKLCRPLLAAWVLFATRICAELVRPGMLFDCRSSLRYRCMDALNQTLAHTLSPVSTHAWSAHARAVTLSAGSNSNIGRR